MDGDTQPEDYNCQLHRGVTVHLYVLFVLECLREELATPPPSPAPFLVALRGGKFEVSSQFGSGVELGPTGHPKAGDLQERVGTRDVASESRTILEPAPTVLHGTENQVLGGEALCVVWGQRDGDGTLRICRLLATRSIHFDYFHKTKEGCFGSGGRPPAWWYYERDERDERVVGVTLEGPVQFTAVQQSASGTVVGARSSAARQEYTVHAYRRLHPS